MKTVFILNPCAGQKKDLNGIIESIKNAARELKNEVEIYVTRAVGDAEKYVMNAGSPTQA